MINNNTLDKTQPEQKLIVVNIAELLNRELPRRQEILTPWLLGHSSNMVYAWRGVGKTHVALGIAYAVASGGTFLKWHAYKPRKVLYIDGEMPAIVIKERLSKIAGNSSININPENLAIITPDLQNRPMPNIGTKEGQEIVDRYITEGIELIIIDNLSSLVRSGRKENEAESWDGFEEWLLRHRATGKCFLIIHHAGKNGGQRGTSKREDLMDTVIQLKRPNDCSKVVGACFEVHFEKTRTIYGDAAQPFTATLVDHNESQIWKIDNVNAQHSRLVDIIELKNEGLNQTEIADRLGLHKSTISRELNKSLN